MATGKWTTRVANTSTSARMAQWFGSRILMMEIRGCLFRAQLADGGILGLRHGEGYLL